MRLDERIPNLASELKLDNILPSFWPKNGRKLAKYPILSVFDRFFFLQSQETRRAVSNKFLSQGCGYAVPV